MPEPLFILCPLRSYSSLVCGMLGQHPEMYGLLEQNLFQADTLQELVLHQKMTRPHSDHGLLRTLAQLHEGRQDFQSINNAKAWIAAHHSWSTKEVLDHIMAAVEPKIVIDKSPSTVMTQECIERMYRFYPKASFLHLTRHPRSTCNSICSLVDLAEGTKNSFVVSQYDPEEVWLTTHRNIVQFTSRLPLGQSMRIKGEELLNKLDLYLPQIAEWLGIRTDAEAIEMMMHPENSPYASFGPINAAFGSDPNFLDSPILRPSRLKESSLDGPLQWDTEREFSQETRKLAKEFGYC